MQTSNDRLDETRAKLEQLRVDVEALPPRTDLSAAHLAGLANAGSSQGVNVRQPPQLAALGAQVKPAVAGFTANPPRVFYGARSWRKYNVYKFIDEITAYAAPTFGEIDDAQRVLVCASYMRGDAFSWYASHLNLHGDARVKPEPAWASDFNLFKEALVAAFGDPYKYKHDADRLRRLRQTGAAWQYATQFRRLAAELDWPDTVLKDYFIEGLKDDLRRALPFHLERDSLNELIDWVVELDQRIHNRWR